MRDRISWSPRRPDQDRPAGHSSRRRATHLRGRHTMDQIEAFLETLLENSPDQYRTIAQKAVDIYQGRCQLTVKLKAWALRAAKAQGVAVPDAFDDLPAFEPMTRTYA